VIVASISVALGTLFAAIAALAALAAVWQARTLHRVWHTRTKGCGGRLSAMDERFGTTCSERSGLPAQVMNGSADDTRGATSYMFEVGDAHVVIPA
jgi:hypothetical protein